MSESLSVYQKASIKYFSIIKHSPIKVRFLKPINTALSMKKLNHISGIATNIESILSTRNNSHTIATSKPSREMLMIKQKSTLETQYRRKYSVPPQTEQPNYTVGFPTIPEKKANCKSYSNFLLSLKSQMEPPIEMGNNYERIEKLVKYGSIEEVHSRHSSPSDSPKEMFPKIK